ncbi:MAG: DUF2235 domain-containing protein [Ferruginibacter sp.]
MKRIITCSDGTWNTINPDRGTNVIKLYDAISKMGVDADGNNIAQVKCYDEGVGTGYSLKDKIFGGATGSGIDKNIKDMYIFIILNYDPGDELYLFGFSRGAYTARSLSGLIRNSGILLPQNLDLVDKAYELYRDKNDYSSPDSDLMISFRNKFAVEEKSPIHFIGVWDTVGALGIPLPWYRILNMKKYKFHDVKLSSYVKYAYHALAIDEKRKLFDPTLWTQSYKAIADPGNDQILEQCWFAGTHSNVGGGYPDSGLSNIALQWLLKKAKGAGLGFTDTPVGAARACDLGKVVNSYTLPYWFWRPKPRKLLRTERSNEIIDESVWERLASVPGYRTRPLVLIDNLKENGHKPPFKLNLLKETLLGVPELIAIYFLIILFVGVLLLAKMA